MFWYCEHFELQKILHSVAKEEKTFVQARQIAPQKGTEKDYQYERQAGKLRTEQVATCPVRIR